jgi:hypothetical protein
MAPDSADVEMEGEFSNPFLKGATSRKPYWWEESEMKYIVLNDTGVLNRPTDQEDEDTEQKIINEGSCSAAKRDGSCSPLL